MTDFADALTPAGAGTQRVLTSWKELVRHSDTPCERCLPVIRAVRTHNRAPGDLLDACCEVGQGLARAWIDACVDLTAHLIALHQV